MSSIPAFRLTARLGLATTVLMFGLIVLGSIVRTTGSGLACPDWPLCHGRLIPPFQFNVMMEWLHRLVALLVSLLLVATVGVSLLHREVRSRVGGLAGLAVALLLTQILLGALTVWKLLSPAVVSSHLAVALLLFTSLLVLTLVAQAEADGGTMVDRSRARPPGLLALLAGTTALVYLQALLGGIVSTSHAGLACPDWPTCNGQWFPALEGLVGLQMLHRLGAYALTLAMIGVMARTRTGPDAGLRAGGRMALGLTLAQVVLGVTNVFLGTPVWLSAAHLATAAAILAIMVTLTFRAAQLPADARRPLAAAAS
jgi:cytochrome c oxidase assembly protein subunit 15